jgi:hypothetical protein
MNLRKISIIVLALFALGIDRNLYANETKRNDVDYTIYVDEIVRSFAKEMKKEFGLVCVGSGGGMPYDVEEIEVEFYVYQNATIEQARELEVKVTEKFLEKINKHKKIRPYLREYPFVSKRAKVILSFNDSNNMRYLDGSVVLLFQARGNLCYFKAEPTKTKKYTTEDLVKIHVEPYEEALKIVNEGKDKKKA